MKLLRTIRLDASDSFVYPRAAGAGEWAIPGAFEFWGGDPKSLAGRDRQAFRAGFLGLGSFGWSTLVVAQPISAEERAAAVASLAAYLLAVHGAPDRAAARAAAEEEITADVRPRDSQATDTVSLSHAFRGIVAKLEIERRTRHGEINEVRSGVVERRQAVTLGYQF